LWRGANVDGKKRKSDEEAKKKQKKSIDGKVALCRKESGVSTAGGIFLRGYDFSLAAVRFHHGQRKGGML
jgi:hypothetical protein